MTPGVSAGRDAGGVSGARAKGRDARQFYDDPRTSKGTADLEAGFSVGADRPNAARPSIKVALQGTRRGSTGRRETFEHQPWRRWKISC